MERQSAHSGNGNATPKLKEAGSVMQPLKARAKTPTWFWERGGVTRLLRNAGDLSIHSAR